MAECTKRWDPGIQDPKEELITVSRASEVASKDMEHPLNTYEAASNSYWEPFEANEAALIYLIKCSALYCKILKPECTKVRNVQESKI